MPSFPFLSYSRRAPYTPAARSRVVAWIRRYGAAELTGVGTALAGSYVVYAATGNAIAAAYGGALGENLGFYGVIVGREVWRDLRAARRHHQPYGPRAALRTGTNLLLEFGGAEVLDSTLIRPLAMGLGAQYLGRRWGVLVGKIVADLTFYIPVICAYELKRLTGRVAETE